MTVISVVAPEKTKDKKSLEGDTFYQTFMSLPVDDAVVYFANLDKKDQDGIIAKSLINLMRK